MKVQSTSVANLENALKRQGPLATLAERVEKAAKISPNSPSIDWSRSNKWLEKIASNIKSNVAPKQIKPDSNSYLYKGVYPVIRGTMYIHHQPYINAYQEARFIADAGFKGEIVVGKHQSAFAAATAALKDVLGKFTEK
jgi:hypothetical protein